MASRSHTSVEKDKSVKYVGFSLLCSLSLGSLISIHNTGPVSVLAYSKVEFWTKYKHRNAKSRQLISMARLKCKEEG
jgi:hypothetical protein